MEGKKIAFVGVLLLVIVAAAIYTTKRFASADKPKPSQWVLEQPEELIDKGSFELVTLPIGEWRKLGKDEMGHYKNPKTGSFTMVKPITCPSCGAKIPRPDVAASAPGQPPPALCPKCGKPLRQS